LRVFITGASGVIGRRVVPQLVAGGHQVSAVARSPAKRQELDRLGVRPVSVDLFDGGSIAQSLAGHDTAINLATHIPHSTAKTLLPGAWRENDRLRRITSRLLVNTAIAQGVARIVQESFAPVYAGQGDAWITEEWPLQPVRYNRTVMDAEQAAERFTRSGGVGIVLRFAGFYGPDSTQLGDMLQSVRRGPCREIPRPSSLSFLTMTQLPRWSRRCRYPPERTTSWMTSRSAAECWAIRWPACLA